MSHHQQDPIKYGDVFSVSGELASKPVAPRDAAAMQAAETAVFGQTQKGGPAAVMQSAASVNESLGVVGHDDVSDKAREGGVTIAQGVDVSGHPLTAELVGEQVVGGYRERNVEEVSDRDKVTIGEALEAAALTGEDRPIDTSDAAAIQAAEVRATGRRQVIPGGVGAEAQAAAMKNPLLRDEDKTMLADVLTDASGKLPRDKAVTKEYALGIAAAEARNDPSIRPHDDGVAQTMLAAARLNQQP